MNIKPILKKNFYIFSTDLSVLQKLQSELDEHSCYLDDCISFVQNAKVKLENLKTAMLEIIK